MKKQTVVVACARRNGDTMEVLVGPVEYEAGWFMGPPMAELTDGLDVAAAAIGLLKSVGLRMDQSDVALWGVVSGSIGAEHVVVRCPTYYGDVRCPWQWMILEQAMPLLPDHMRRWMRAVWQNQAAPTAERVPA